MAAAAKNAPVSRGFVLPVLPASMKIHLVFCNKKSLPGANRNKEKRAARRAAKYSSRYRSSFSFAGR